jgi:hypothetical protein
VNPHLADAVDGYARARDDEERRFYLRAVVRGLVAMADATSKGLRLLLQSLTKE